MTKNLSLLLLLVWCALAFEGCAIHDYENDQQSNLRNEYAKFWIKKFGLIDPNQDWCGVSAITAEITMLPDASKLSVYNDSPGEGGHLIGRISHNGTLKLDMPKGSERIYARYTDASGHVVSRGYYTVIDGYVMIAGDGVDIPKSRAEGDAVTYAHTPSYFDAMIICEDLGSIGDFDFNDVVLGLKHISGDDAKLIIVPMAAGGTLASKIYFDGGLLGETHDMIKAGTSSSNMLNTSTPHIGSVTRLNHYEISLDDSKYDSWTIADGWGDISIEIVNAETTITINRPTEGLAPQMICLGGDWFWPQETLDINDAYLGFGDWSCEAGALTWLGSWKDDKVVKWDVPSTDPEDPEEPQDDRMWFKAITSDNSNYSVHLNGSSAATEIVSGEKYYVETPWTSCENMFAVYSTSQAFILNSDGNFVLGYPTVDNKITEIEFSENFDMSAVTTFAHMFDGSRSLTSVNVEDWNAPTRALTDVTAMFHYCERLTSLDLGGWDVSSVNSYFDVFGYCSALSTLDLSGWQIKSGANLRRFLGDTKNMTVRCSSSVESVLLDDNTVGGTNITYTRP